MGKEATSKTILNYSKELIKLGNKVVVIAEKRNEKNRKGEIDGVKVYRIGGVRYFGFYNRMFGHALGVRKMQKYGRFDVVHSFSSAPILVLRSLFSKLFSKAKIVHTMKAYSRSKFGDMGYFLLNYADKITVPTKVFADKLVQKGVKKNKIAVIRSHIDTSVFVPKDKTKLKRKYGYNGKKVIFYYGAMWDLKGVNYLIDAMHSVAKQDVVFVFAPRNIDNYVEGYKQQLTMMGLSQYCDFVLEDVNIAEYVAMADMVVLPYPSLKGTEGNPSCLIEAIACKTNVVTSDLPELREILNSKEVMFSEPKNSKSLAVAINTLLKDAQLSKKMANAAYKKSKDFDLKKITKEFVDLYKHL